MTDSSKQVGDQGWAGLGRLRLGVGARSERRLDEKCGSGSFGTVGHSYTSLSCHSGTNTSHDFVLVGMHRVLREYFVDTSMSPS